MRDLRMGGVEEGGESHCDSLRGWQMCEKVHSKAKPILRFPSSDEDLPPGTRVYLRMTRLNGRGRKLEKAISGVDRTKERVIRPCR